MSGVEIAERIGYTVVQVSRIRRRFAETVPADQRCRVESGRKDADPGPESTQPLLPLRPGLRARQTHDYRRNGLTSLYAELEVATGRVLGACTPRPTGDDFLRFLQQVARTYRGRELHIVLDSSSTHGMAAVQTWLAIHPHVHFNFTPKGASWLNMVEAWFSVLTHKSVRRGSFDTVRALIRHVEGYVAEWNAHPTPFV